MRLKGGDAITSPKATRDKIKARGTINKQLHVKKKIKTQSFKITEQLIYIDLN